MTEQAERPWLEDPLRRGRFGPWMAAVWLFFLFYPLQEGWRQRDHWTGIVGMVVTVAFAADYMVTWLLVRHGREQMVRLLPLRQAVPLFGVMVALAAGMIALLGQSGTASLVYLAVTVVTCFPILWAGAFVLAEVVGCLVVARWVPGWSGMRGLALTIGAAFVAVYGVVTVLRRNMQLVAAQEENSRLVVENERSRFARDLHDILGHSLTVITVKAELAQRLLAVDPARARAELADLERLSRDALADVRQAVRGYREVTLPGELAAARTALEAAGIDAVLPGAADVVDTRARELFAWAVREGVTNVIRHSSARHCTVTLSSDRVTICDDGIGSTTAAGGTGLMGLRERAGAIGGLVVVRSLSPGFSLEVSL